MTGTFLRPSAIAVNAFGTLIQYGGTRLNLCRRLFDDHASDHEARLRDCWSGGRNGPANLDGLQ